MSKTLSQFRAEIGYPQQDNNSSEKFALGGGLSIEEVAAIGDPAKLLSCKNYEPNYAGGYRSKIGCEPFDGHRQPSAFLYTLLPISRTNTANNPTQIGQQINQLNSGVFEVGPYFLGWETVGTQDYIVLTNVVKSLITTSYQNPNIDVDNFQDVVKFPSGTVLYTGDRFAGNSFAVTTGAASFLSDRSKARYYISLARKVARSYIQPVGDGTFAGPARGVFDLWGAVYAIRDKADGSQAGLFLCGATTDPQSWQQLNLGMRVYFRACNSDTLKVGAIVTSVINPGVSCTVQNLVIQFGTVGAADATGYIVTDQIFGGSFAPLDGLRVDAINVAVTPADPVQAYNMLPANGAYRFKRWNFTGVSNNAKVYGISTKWTGFEIAINGGSPGFITFTPIITGQGLTADTFNNEPVMERPNRIEVSHDQLFLAYPGGNLQHSGYQTPTGWTAVQGADQRMLGDDITNMIGNINNTMIISTQHRLRILYGDVLENYQLRDLNTEAGAYANTAMPIGGVCFLTDEGLNFYDQTANFGNYAGTSLSQGINSLLKEYMATGMGPLEATIQRDHSFYRLYFDKGVCFTICIVGKDLKGIGKCEYEMGSTIYWNTGGGSAPPYSIGDTFYNFDKTDSFVLTKQVLLTGSVSRAYFISSTKIDPDKWPAGSMMIARGNPFGVIDSATVNTPKTFWSVASTITNGNGMTPPGERIFFCSDDGYVYEDDTGGSWGIVGNPVDFEAQTQFYYGTAALDNEKCYRRMRVDVIGADAFSNLSLGAEYDDGAGYRNPEVMENVTNLLATSGFDQNAVYGVGFYGGAGKNVLRKTLHGTGVGISIKFKGSSDIAFSHTVQAVQIALALRSRRTWR